LAHAEKPFETFHGLHKDVMVSGFWLRNEMGITDVTSKTEADGIMQAQGAVDYTHP
jgi:hypothetical protein